MKKQTLSEKKQVQKIQRALAKNYFELIQMVGSHGKYQRNIFLVFALILFVTATILQANSFMFLNNSYGCQQQGLLAENCKKVVCEISDQKERIKYFKPNKQQVQSIATEFGPFMCESQQSLDLVRSTPYFGSFLAFIIFSYISDNFGRRKTMIISLSVATIGCIMISTGYNLVMVAIGAVLSGGGINASCGGAFYFLSQVVQNKKRQKYSALMQAAYPIGSMMVTGFYYYFQKWRIVSILLQGIPVVICLFIFVFYVEQTPLFLLKGPNAKSLKALNRIGNINFKIKQIISQADLQNVKRQQLLSEQYNKIKVSPLDVVRFKSLRLTTILCCIAFYVTFSMYYGPALIIDKIGFNTYVTSFAIQFSQLIGYVPCYYYIDKVGRRKAGIVIFLVCIVSSFVLILVQKPSNCQICLQSVVQLVVIFVFRFAISLQFAILNIYAIELFPTRVVGVCSGMTSIAGTLASTLSPIILGSLERIQFNLMLLFFILAIIGLFVSFLLRQTLGKPIRRQIQEIQEAKHDIKTNFTVKDQYFDKLQSREKLIDFNLDQN